MNVKFFKNTRDFSSCRIAGKVSKRKSYNLINLVANHTDITIKWHDGGDEWRFIGIYGFPETHNKLKTCDLILDLNRHSSLHWLIGGPMKPQTTLDAFNDTLSVYDLVDLGFMVTHGGMDKRTRVRWKSARIELSALFPNARVTHIDDDFSDHLPFQQKKNQREHFEHFWALDDRCEEVFSKAWEPITSADSILHCMEKIKCCMTELSAWSYSTFGNIQHEIHKCRTLLKSTSYASARKAIFEEISQLRKQEDVLWSQQSRMEFHKFGNYNSAWFHRKANMRRAANQITKLKDIDGQSYREAHDLERIIVAYFGDTFYAQTGPVALSTPATLRDASIRLSRSSRKGHVVGDGWSLSVWDSKWVPRPCSFKVITPPNPLTRLFWFGDLIDRDQGVWNQHMIKSISYQVDADIILSIPLCTSWFRDKLT
ncbi:LOW QUALITY PROTEIN: hypothetical protein Cgig2_004873 [Carnegiea gigantea]|uniref:Uncharacterized protein n=1 Tax=Carnegiea gigantea TaxID=171969 RepID=A0A9Q1JYE3_9CARY|nr:LOW QUALITY PROTEIN: hypothetical protein Cgig2_004873 [Carnegiea gigantea]